MITVCVPDETYLPGIDDLGDTVRVLVWNGVDEPPHGVADTDFLVAGYADRTFRAESIEQLPKLTAIQALSAGVEQWLAYVPDGVTLANGRGVHGSSTAELAVAGLLSIVRGLPFYLGEQQAHRWAQSERGEVGDRRVLILGAGDIGTRVAAALDVFGADTVLVGRSAREGVHAIGELAALLPTADAVVIAMPLTDQTRGLVDAGFLAALPDGAIVVNVARGPVVDTNALLAELGTRRLHAFLDVTDPEPLPAEHPLWSAPNVVITPHIGGGTEGWAARGQALIRAQIEHLLAGEPLDNVVN
ncbi:MAG: serA [Frankiales bacterium]|nr:serA [Frankiales bacterium]